MHYSEMRIKKVADLVEQLGGKLTIDDVDQYTKGTTKWTVMIDLPYEYEGPEEDV